MGNLHGLPEKMGTVFIIDSYTRFQESEKRLEEAEGNSPGQRPVVIITSPICDAPKVQKSFPYSIKDFFQEFENLRIFFLLNC